MTVLLYQRHLWRLCHYFMNIIHVGYIVSKRLWTRIYHIGYVLTWQHRKRFRHYWPFVRGILRSTVPPPPSQTTSYAGLYFLFVVTLSTLLSKQSIWRSCHCNGTIHQYLLAWSLYVVNFATKNKHAFAIYIIPPQWHDTGSWNPNSCKTRTDLVYIVNIIADDGLMTQGVRA